MIGSATVALLGGAAAQTGQAPQTGRPPSPREFLDEDALPPTPEGPDAHHEFTFARTAYSGRNWGWASWTTDYPKADRQFLIGVKRLTRIDLRLPARDQCDRLLDDALSRSEAHGDQPYFPSRPSSR